MGDLHAWAAVAPFLSLAAVGLIVVASTERLADCWRSLFAASDDERDRAQRAWVVLSEARQWGGVTREGVRVVSHGAAGGWWVGDVLCTTDDEAIRAIAARLP